MTIGTKEWKPNNENCISGCENNCLYCYAALSADRYKRIPRADWHTMKLNKRSQKPIKFLRGGVMFPTTHDLHYKHRLWWMPFLHSLLAMKNDVLIVTKPEYESIRLICTTFPHFKDKIEFRFTMGTNDDKTAAYWEPGAPSPSDRLLPLSLAYLSGFRTSVSMEPLLMEDPTLFVRHLIVSGVTGEIWIGTMNHYQLNPDIPQEARQIKIQSKENMQKVYDSLKDNPQIRWKDSVQELLGVKNP
jgi:DNA repair photolyase